MLNIINNTSTVLPHFHWMMAKIKAGLHLLTVFFNFANAKRFCCLDTRIKLYLNWEFNFVFVYISV